jgi:hypothetical protein
MLRYFFHVVDDHGREQDSVGAELASDQLELVSGVLNRGEG